MHPTIPALALIVTSSSLALSACSDNSDSPSPDAAAPISAEPLLRFDPTKGELPEAVSFRDGAAYVSLVATGQIAKITYPALTRTIYAQLPVQPSNYTLGSAFDAAGNLFVAVAATSAEDERGVAAAGIYRVTPQADGAVRVTQWATGRGLTFPNGLTFDAAGNLYVTDAAEGAVYRFPAGVTPVLGAAVPWKQDAALAGSQDACPARVRPFAVGANGIVAEAGAVWVANTDTGSLLTIAVATDGTAGAVVPVAHDCTRLEGVDGLRVDPSEPGAFLAANNTAPSIVRIRRTGEITTLIAGKPTLHSPADLAHVPGSVNPAVVLVVNASFDEALAPPEAGLVPVPSLMKLTL